MNSRALESLIKCGALDNLGTNRRQMFAMSKTVLADLEFENKNNISGQMSFFDLGDIPQEDVAPKIPDLAEYPKAELLEMENEVA